jgi:allantoin racemase
LDLKQVVPLRLMLSEPVPGEVSQPHWDWYRKTIEAVARPGTNVDFVTLKRGYSQPTTPYTKTYNSLAMTERAIESQNNGYDAFLIGCASDLGLRESRSLIDIPVIAPLESGVFVASILGHKFSIIVLDKYTAPMFAESIRNYGLAENVASIRHPSGLNSDMAFDMMFGGKLNEFSNIITAEMGKAVREDGAEALIVACTIASTLLTISGIHQVDKAPIVDLISAEIKMAETMVDLKRAYGTLPCKSTIYHPPHTSWEKEIPIIFD